jgi:hypothetical protein
MHQQLWGYKVEEKLHVGVREQKRLNTTALVDRNFDVPLLSGVLSEPNVAVWSFQLWMFRNVCHLQRRLSEDLVFVFHHAEATLKQPFQIQGGPG